MVYVDILRGEIGFEMSMNIFGVAYLETQIASNADFCGRTHYKLIFGMGRGKISDIQG